MDPPTVLAIASDFDDLDENALRQIRPILDSIKESVAHEEETGFDPSGSSGAILNNAAVDNSGFDHAESCPEFATRSRGTDATNLAPALSSLDLEDSLEGSGSEPLGSQSGDISSGLETLDKDEKEVRLKEMFPSLGVYTVTYALKKCNGNIDRAMDVLLNTVYFEEEDSKPDNVSKLAPKGIEGFAGQHGGRKGRRSKKRKARLLGDDRRSSSTSRSWDSEDSTSENKWDLGRKDVEFVTSRTVLTAQKVCSVYHAKGASLPATIHSLVTAEIDKPAAGIVTFTRHPTMGGTPTANLVSHQNNMPEEALQTPLAELTQTFPTFSEPKLAALLRLSRNSPSAARELAEVMMRRPNYVETHPSTPPSLSIQVLPQHSPIDFRSEDESETYTSRLSTTDASIIRAQAVFHGASGSIKFTQASTAYRLGKSQPLMGGAAAYYSEEGRKHMKAAKELDAAAAEAHVQAHSTTTRLDLHGVSVHHAVHIAKARVRQWWEGLGDAKFAPGGGGPVREGYEIVTGKGSHSKVGAPQIGPAVLRQLTAEGWKVEARVGYLVVKGVARRR